MAFISELDKTLQRFDQQFPEKSASQVKNILKYKRIFQLRDQPDNAMAGKNDIDFLLKD